MRFAYADPPYLGQGARRYGYPEWDKVERHQQLIDQLVTEYPDGWALSMGTNTMRTLLPLCPPDVRIAAWVKTFCAFKRGVRPCYAWEPVVFWKGRNPPHFRHDPPPKNGKQTTPKDFIGTVLAEPITLQKGLTGAKPEAFCQWVLDLLGYQPGDELIDLWPGTGVMGRVVNA